MCSLTPTQLLGRKNLLTSMKITCKGLSPGLETWRWEGGRTGRSSRLITAELILGKSRGKCFELRGWRWLPMHTHLVSSGHMDPDSVVSVFRRCGPLSSAEPSPSLFLRSVDGLLLPPSFLSCPSFHRGPRVAGALLPAPTTCRLRLWVCREAEGRVSGDSGRCSFSPSCPMKETFLGLPQALLWAPRRAQIPLQRWHPGQVPLGSLHRSPVIPEKLSLQVSGCILAQKASVSRPPAGATPPCILAGCCPVPSGECDSCLVPATCLAFLTANLRVALLPALCIPGQKLQEFLKLTVCLLNLQTANDGSLVFVNTGCHASVLVWNKHIPAGVCSGCSVKPCCCWMCGGCISASHGHTTW